MRIKQNPCLGLAKWAPYCGHKTEKRPIITTIYHSWASDQGCRMFSSSVPSSVVPGLVRDRSVLTLWISQLWQTHQRQWRRQWSPEQRCVLSSAAGTAWFCPGGRLGGRTWAPPLLPSNLQEHRHRAQTMLRSHRPSGTQTTRTCPQIQMTEWK